MDRRRVLRTKLSLECRFERSERNMALVNVREVMGKMFERRGNWHAKWKGGCNLLGRAARVTSCDKIPGSINT